MGTFIKIVAAFCLVVIWAIVGSALVGSVGVPRHNPYAEFVSLALVPVAILLSLPVAMVYALGSIASDMREAVRYLHAMQKYNETGPTVNRRDPTF